MNQNDIPGFQKLVLSYYDESGRHDLPWRQPDANGLFDPYKILVSELMLQQTQVGRVIPKFKSFIEAFPSFASLAPTPLSDVLKMWSGLGYNRRAKFLLQTAQVVAAQYQGSLPRTKSELVALPGIGPNTAGAILAYAFNEQVVFVETNIRTVYIHHFFKGHDRVSDKDLLPLVASSIPRGDARLWYWALMDYGTYLKQTVGNLSRVSTAYAKQSTFKGSRRQIRGQILKILAAQHTVTQQELIQVVDDERLLSVLEDLTKESFIELSGSHYQLRA